MKPDNTFIDENGNIIIGDMGLCVDTSNMRSDEYTEIAGTMVFTNLFFQ